MRCKAKRVQRGLRHVGFVVALPWLLIKSAKGDATEQPPYLPTCCVSVCRCCVCVGPDCGVLIVVSNVVPQRAPHTYGHTYLTWA